LIIVNWMLLNITYTVIVADLYGYKDENKFGEHVN